MLNRARDADGHVELRTHLTSGLTDLISVRTPSLVGDGARCPDRGVAKGVSQVFNKFEILGRLEAAAAGDDHWRVGEVGTSLRPFDDLRHLHS